MRKLFATLIIILVAVISVQAKTFVLVHGALADGTVWFKLKPLLEARGNKVVVVNLPGHGKDNTPVSEISYQSYTSAIINSIKAQQEKVILVGHSMAGLLIASVAEQVPDKIEALVFLAAFMPGNGDSVFGLNATDSESQFGSSLVVAADNSYATLRHDKIADVFCVECSTEDKALLLLSHKAEPLAPLAEKIRLSEEVYGGIPKYCIITTMDHAVGKDIQRKLAMRSSNVKKIFQIKSGHLPFLSKPHKLLKVLLRVEKANQ